MRRSIPLFLTILLLAAPARALTGESLEHARSALLFAERKDWNNALQHAHAAHDAAILKLVRWQADLDPSSGADFAEIDAFLRENPNWPEEKKLRLRAEQSLRNAGLSDHAVIAWFGGEMPLTGAGKIALAEALMRQNAPREKTTYLIRDAWRNGDFDENQESRIAQTYGSLLRQEDETGRIDRLLWDGKIAPAERMLGRVPREYQLLYKARVAYMEDRKTAIISMALVPKAQRRDLGLIYDRMRYRARRKDNSGARELLLVTPAHVPYAEKWWKTRENQARAAIDERNYALARKLLANHAQASGQEFADAMWLQGWVECEFMNNPKTAYGLFHRMYGEVKYPVSKARAAYWAGIASTRAGDAQSASKWYALAAAYPTTFYGQLALLKAGGRGAVFHLPAAPQPTAEDKRQFARNDLAQAAELAAQLGETDLANHLIGYLAENAATPGQALLAAEIGRCAGYGYLSVRAAKKALQSGIVLIGPGYPKPLLPANLPVEPALTLAIARQESEFDPKARSGSGALGMMQLLPGTARETARRTDLGYAENRLYEPAYNMTLGSYYLSRLMSGYNGSYVMAIASYNAGPGNVRNWIQQFGTPGSSPDSAVMWIERIPFAETRNYVQRVMENLQVYRQLNAGNAAHLEIGNDLVR